MTAPLTTPNGRYIVVRGRLWRATHPGLSSADREALVDRLMVGRRAVAQARANDDSDALAAARGEVEGAKVGLGERDPVWWTDGAPDLNRHMARNTS